MVAGTNQTFVARITFSGRIFYVVDRKAKQLTALFPENPASLEDAVEHPAVLKVPKGLAQGAAPTESDPGSAFDEWHFDGADLMVEVVGPSTISSNGAGLETYLPRLASLSKVLNGAVTVKPSLLARPLASADAKSLIRARVFAGGGKLESLPTSQTELEEEEWRFEAPQTGFAPNPAYQLKLTDTLQYTTEPGVELRVLFTHRDSGVQDSISIRPPSSTEGTVDLRIEAFDADRPGLAAPAEPDATDFMVFYDLCEIPKQVENQLTAGGFPFVDGVMPLEVRPIPRLVNPNPAGNPPFYCPGGEP